VRGRAALRALARPRPFAVVRALPAFRALVPVRVLPAFVDRPLPALLRAAALGRAAPSGDAATPSPASARFDGRRAGRDLAAARRSGSGRKSPSPKSICACQPHSSRTQRRTVPYRFITFSVTKGAPHDGHGSAIGLSHTAKVQSG
jgi:hypothetical protein